MSVTLLQGCSSRLYDLTVGITAQLRLVTAGRLITASDNSRIGHVLRSTGAIRRILAYYPCQNHVWGNCGFEPLSFAAADLPPLSLDSVVLTKMNLAMQSYSMHKTVVHM